MKKIKKRFPTTIAQFTVDNLLDFYSHCVNYIEEHIICELIINVNPLLALDGFDS